MQKQMLLRALDQQTSIHLTQGREVTGTLASHFHCAYIVGMVKKGSLELTYNETRLRLGAGSYYLMNPFTIHQIRFSTPTDYQTINIKMEDVKRVAGDVQLHNMYGYQEMFFEGLLQLYDILQTEHGHFETKQHALKQLIDMFINEQILSL